MRVVTPLEECFTVGPIILQNVLIFKSYRPWQLLSAAVGLMSITAVLRLD